MICSLMIDCDDAADFSGNTGVALGRPFAAYPLLAARASGMITRHYVVTESPPVKGAALQYDAAIIDPPKSSAGLLSRPEQLLRHGEAHVAEELKSDKESLELLVLLSAHAPAVTRDLIEAGIEALQNRPELDSAVSVSPYNRWNPFFARKETPEGLLAPYVSQAQASHADAWFPDWGVCILRPRCLADAKGDRPAPWMGEKVLPLKQWGGGPIDYLWQVPSLEYWLKKNGFTDLAGTMELQPKPQLAPKTDRR
ncbi:MAG: cytidylyltransferase [Elusimicrobiota bacterium]